MANEKNVENVEVSRKIQGLRLRSDRDKVFEVIELLLRGTPLRDAINQCGFSPQAFNRRLQGDKEAAVAYSRAQEFKADLLADEIINIADTSEDPAKARNQIEARKWIASKYNSKRFGDRIDLNVTQTIDIGSTLEEARNRMRPISDLSPTLELQAIELPAINVNDPPDKKSDSPIIPALVPDIFK